MKKKLVAFLLVVILLLQMIPVTGMAYPVPDLGKQDAIAKFKSGTPMSVSHRAAWRNGPECSLIAIAASIRMGIDVAELDVKVTSDGVAVLMHDTDISRTTVGSGNVESMTWDKLKTYAAESGQGSSNNPYKLTEADVALLKSLPNYVAHCGEPEVGGTMPTTRLDDAIDLIKMLGPKTMINWDHCTTQTRFVNSYILFRETGMLDNVFFKNSNNVNTQNAWYSAAATAWNEKHPEQTITADDVKNSILYVYIIRSADYSPLQAHLDNGDKLVMTEICIGDDAVDTAVLEKLEPWCKEKGIAMFINTMWSGLCSTKADTETTWVEMLDRGYVAIQTDQASELASFLYDYNRTRASSEKIQAEHFNLFNYDSYGFSVPESCDSNLNKTVNGMVDGDWISYKMFFTGTETIMNLNLKGLDSSAGVSIYLDEISQENLIANINPGVSSNYTTVSAEITGTVSAGSHTLYIQTTGLPGKDLVSLDHFTFVPASSFEGAKDIAPISVRTEPGVAPVLPGTITVTVGGTAYGLSVRWEQIDPASYAQAGAFSVLGYIPVLKTYTTANITVSTLEPGIAEEHLALWLDASEGITDENGAVTKWVSRLGEIEATVESGSPTLIKNAAGGQQGIRFDGNDIMTLTLPDNFWNKTDAEYTVLMYVSSDQATSGNGTTTSGPSTNGSQRYSVMWFAETADWGAVYFTASQNEVMWRFGSGTDGDRGLTAVRPMNVGTAYTAAAIRKDGLENTVFTDGVKIYTGSSASPNTKNTGSVGKIGWGQHANYVGTICQILIYDTALTDEQIIAAQRWMAQKYTDSVTSVEEVAITCEAGTAPELPTSVKVTYQSGLESSLGVTWEAINPNNYLNAGSFTVKGTLANGMAIEASVTVTAKEEVVFPESNVLLWFSARDGITADTDGKVSAWIDKETGTVTAAQSTADKQPTVVYGGDGSVDGIRFDGGDLMNFNAGMDTFNRLSGITMVVYSKPEGTAPTAINKNHNNSVIYFGEISPPGWSGMYLGTYTNGAAGRFGTGTANYRGVLYSGGSYSDYTTTVLRKNGSEHDELIINGQIISNVTTDKSTSAEITDHIDGSTGMLGYGKNSTAWTGTVREILIFNKSLSDKELEKVYEYLDERYAPKAEIATDGLMLWLDASKGITTDSNGNVTNWASQAGNVSAVEKTSEYGKAKAAPTFAADAINGESGVSFNGSQVMVVPMADGAFNGLTGVTVIAYAKANSTLDTSDSNYNSQRNTLFYVDEFPKDSWSSFYAGIYTNAVSARFGTGTTNDRGVVTTRTAINDFTTTVVRWDGSTKTYDVDVNGNDLVIGTSLAGETNKNANIIYLGTGKDDKNWNGTLCDLLIYNRVLTDAELASAYAYLDSKYAPVVPDTIPVTGIYLKEVDTVQQLYVGDTLPLSASVIPANADNKELIWQSSNSAVASVDENGVVTAKKEGYASISVTTADGGYNTYCLIFVNAPVTSTLWEDIQTLRAWAAGQNSEHYDNWAVMQEALNSTKDVTATASKDELTAAYQTLRAAKLALKLHEHSMTEVERDEPDCTTPGNIAYYTCDTCGRWYVDADGQTEIEDKTTVVIPENGHDWADATCTVPKTCKVCYETEGEPLGHSWTYSADGNVINIYCTPCQTGGTLTLSCTDTVYSGSEKTVTAECTIEGFEIPAITYEGNRTNTGTFTASVQLGEAKAVLEVTITAKPITAADVALAEGSLYHTGSELTQQVVVQEGITYEVSGNKAIEIGDYELTVTGTGNYSGEVKLPWSILKTVAIIGDAYYGSFTEAIDNAAENDMVIVKDNVNLGDTPLELTESITLNLGENTLTGSIEMPFGVTLTTDQNLKDQIIVSANDHLIAKENKGVYTYTIVDTKVTASNMTMGNDLALNFWVWKNELKEGTVYSAKLTRSYADGRENTTITIPMNQWVEKDTYYQVPYEGLSAKEMNDTIKIEIFNGNESASNVFTDSIVAYAKYQLENYTGDDAAKLKTVLVDMLNYGAAAQKEFGYDTDNLANSFLTEEQQGLATKETPKLGDAWKGNGIGYGSNLELKENIILHIWFKNSGVKSVKIAYTDHYEKESSYKEFIANMDDERISQRLAGISSVAVDTLVVADGAQVITCTFYGQEDAQGEPIGQVQESVESYLSYMMAKNTKSNPLYDAIAKFIDSSYNYFH